MDKIVTFDRQITLALGDSRKEISGFPDDTMLIADPPYGISYCHGARRGGKMMGTDCQSITGDDAEFDPSQLLRFERIVLWGANNFAHMLPPNTKWLVWDKRDGVASNDQADCDLAWTNLPGTCRLRTKYWNGASARERSDIRWHVNQKPVSIMQWCIEEASDGAGAMLVLDPYMGSGTTGIACARIGVPYFGIEIDEKCFDIACERMRIELSQGLLGL